MSSVSFGTIVIAAILGILTWPSLEYFLHRFLGHEWSLNTLFRREHQTHHRVRDFFAPAYLKALMTIVVLGSMYFIGRALGLRVETNFYVGGILATYLFYEWTHWRFHKTPPRTRLGMKLRKHHFSHHFKNAKSNYGVTNMVFDHIFGTYLEPGQVSVPQAFAMDWLKTPQGQAKPQYIQDFKIVGSTQFT